MLTDKSRVNVLWCEAEIVRQRRDLGAGPDPKTTTTKTQRIMRRVDFDIAAEAAQATGVDLQPAEEVVRTNRHLLTTPGVLGIWAGARASEPYVMVAIKEDRTNGLRQTIPDSIDGVNVYYLEGVFS